MLDMDCLCSKQKGLAHKSLLVGNNLHLVEIRYAESSVCRINRAIEPGAFYEKAVC
jgi:hypothetical protein